MKHIKAIWYALKTIFYWVIILGDQMKEKNVADTGIAKGMRCEGIKNGIAKFDRTKPANEPYEWITMKKIYRLIEEGEL